MLNLLTDHWLPIRRASGRLETIAPWQITESLENDPVISLNVPRLDFNAALLQFLIGLLQTLMPPDEEDDWLEWRESPPSPEDLQQRLQIYTPYFELAGDGPRFMQDYALAEAEPKPIGALLIDAPGATDHFVKRGGVTGLSPAYAAMALLTLQINAPAGGVGHRTSLRGGGPLTTLVIPTRQDDQPVRLWDLLWWNVLAKPDFWREWLGPDTPEAMFPWAGPIKTSDKKSGYIYTPANTHPAQVYWATPRRIRLDFEHTESGVCSLSGMVSDSLITHYITKNYGANYLAWQHPLSPYYHDKDKQLLPVHAQPGGMTYRHWLGLVANLGATNELPAAVVSVFATRTVNNDNQLWAFGYDMDNMKPRCWYESVMPLHAIHDQASREAFFDLTKKLITAAELCASYLRTALRQAWFGPNDKVDVAKLAYLDSAFWHDSESSFYRMLQDTATHAKRNHLELEQREHLCVNWYYTIKNQTLALFDYLAHSGAWEHENAERIAVAYNELQKKLNGKKLRNETLDLPKRAETTDAAPETMEKETT